MTPVDLTAWSARCEAFVRTHAAGDAAHDLAHVRRVVRAAEHVGSIEGANLSIVLPAAWLHDLVVLPKDAPDRRQASRRSAEAATAWLGSVAFPSDRLAAVAHAIEAHSFSAGVEPRTIEAAVVQDADRLDALGAIGVARLYATAGALGHALVHPDDPVPSKPPTRALDDLRWATDHFQTKLLRLPATMRTAAGRAEAERRAAFLHAFLDELRREVGQ